MEYALDLLAQNERTGIKADGLLGFIYARPLRALLVSGTVGVLRAFSNPATVTDLRRKAPSGRRPGHLLQGLFMQEPAFLTAKELWPLLC